MIPLSRYSSWAGSGDGEKAAVMAINTNIRMYRPERLCFVVESTAVLISFLPVPLMPVTT
jgi:hypothetical protein